MSKQPKKRGRKPKKRRKMVKNHRQKREEESLRVVR